MLLYSLEVPQWGTSNEYKALLMSTTTIFWRRNEKNIYIFWLKIESYLELWIFSGSTGNRLVLAIQSPSLHGLVNPYNVHWCNNFLWMYK